jgi:adenylate cyclase
MDPTLIGDAVNLASRLEGLTRTYGVDILVGPGSRVDLRRVSPAHCCAGAGTRKHRADGNFESAIFTQAKILFSQFLEFYPDDSLAKMYLERALEYEQQPPDEAWNAVEAFKKK